MSLGLDHSQLAPLLGRLSPYLLRQLTRAGESALELHADEVGLEHYFWMLTRDDDSALFAAIDQAFADTDTVIADVLSLCSGILVTTQGGALPISTGGVRAATAAGEMAREMALEKTSCACLLLAAHDELAPDLQRDLAAAGLDLSAVRAALVPGSAAHERGGHLFKHFSIDARQAVVLAAQAATLSGEKSVGPARLLAAALAADGDLAGRAGLSAKGARNTIGDRAHDPSPPPPRVLGPDQGLLAFLGSLEPGATSLDLAHQLLCTPETELAQVFVRQKITPALLMRARVAYDDPSE